MLSVIHFLSHILGFWISIDKPNNAKLTMKTQRFFHHKGHREKNLFYLCADGFAF